MNLEQLWRDRVEEILGICAAGGDSHREVAVMSEYVEADYHGRFLVELLQNANDQALKAGRRDSTVTVLRTASLFAAEAERRDFRLFRIAHHHMRTVNDLRGDGPEVPTVTSTNCKDFVPPRDLRRGCTQEGNVGYFTPSRAAN